MCYLTPPLYSPPPFAISPPGGNSHLAQKAYKILGAKGAKENFYKVPNAPKLIHTVTPWYSFVVQSPPPPPQGETVTS